MRHYPAFLWPGFEELLYAYRRDEAVGERSCRPCSIPSSEQKWCIFITIHPPFTSM